ncbi:altronate hydrolase [Sporanaerobium hydrogeniformans]|uniref:Altronate hydrolase n=1 Tax=Sporanaerobium hydrogeniformans TaxID=3072179 RepID=A0AC61DAB1_9FIRM|nr:altronate dehydratase family protein [Sporanaerobium hydrogeniformans]PHV70234.1 altronate hydrolase [Sporanaerobium hydrogeniformans]
MLEFIKIHENDNVAIALTPLSKGIQIEVAGQKVELIEDIPQGHKFALVSIKEGEPIKKYGYPIGVATAPIQKGAWIHTQNLKTGLGEVLEYTYEPNVTPVEVTEKATFMGYVRKDGKVGIRNDVWIIPTVGCVNSIADQIIKAVTPFAEGKVDSIHTFNHPYGCSQMGDDQLNTQKALAALVNHPNAGAVLVLGLGCENNNIPEFKKVLGEYDEERVKFLECQEYEDEIEEGVKVMEKLITYAAQFKREEVDASELVIGLKCGGSDGLSGITANPLVGKFSDMLISKGGSTILTEVPEMFGAETILMNRCVSEEVFHATVGLINGFKDYYKRHDQVIYENPSPGNKKGGISTLEDKSLGCTQKGGTAPVVDVLAYGEKVCKKGLNLLQAPGNDLVAATSLAMSGAHIVLFTTGRGTPFGSPVPTIKISTNDALFNKKKGWIDFNAGSLVKDKTMEELSKEFFEYVLKVASGEQTKSEKAGCRDLAIFKQGVTL